MKAGAMVIGIIILAMGGFLTIGSYSKLQQLNVNTRWFGASDAASKEIADTGIQMLVGIILGAVGFGLIIYGAVKD